MNLVCSAPVFPHQPILCFWRCRSKISRPGVLPKPALCSLCKHVWLLLLDLESSPSHLLVSPLALSEITWQLHRLPCQSALGTCLLILTLLRATLLSSSSAPPPLPHSPSTHSISPPIKAPPLPTPNPPHPLRPLPLLPPLLPPLLAILRRSLPCLCLLLIVARGATAQPLVVRVALFGVLAFVAVAEGDDGYDERAEG